MKITLKIDIQKCLGQLNLSNDIKKALIEKFIDDFLNFNKKTLQNIFHPSLTLRGEAGTEGKTPYPFNGGKGINQDLFSVSVKVKFIKVGKKPYQEILVYGIDELKTLSYSRFRRAIYEQILIKKIDVNTITDLFIIIRYKY